jgi:leader peptidase (prepilin peptidase)/N-methyltransferase
MRIIPDRINLAIALASFLAFEPIKLFGILVAVIFYIIAIIFGGMGGGDIKLMAAAGLVLGFNKSMVAMAIGLTALLVFHACNILIQKLRGRMAPKAYPLAPFLSLGCIAAYYIF